MSDFYYDISPKLLCVGRDTVVEITPLFAHSKFVDQVNIRVEIHFLRSGRKRQWKKFNFKNGKFFIRIQTDYEEEFHIILQKKENGKYRQIANFALYSLEEDLYSLRPYKGDFYLHSTQSNGTESPAYIAAASRRIGYDFMAVTDYGLYQPSLDAKSSFETVNIGLNILPGEEVNVPNNPVRIISLGAEQSINKLLTNNINYEIEVNEISNSLNVMLNSTDKYIFASTIWCFEKIRKAHGIGILCQPYWPTPEQANISELLQDVLYQEHPFDACELVGGAHFSPQDEDFLQLSKYWDERAKGRETSVVGLSGARSCSDENRFGKYYTVVFAKDCTFDSLKKAIIEGRSIAIEKGDGNQLRANGPYRLVKFFYYLNREVFPLHDNICAVEGAAMLNFLKGNHFDSAERMLQTSTEARDLYSLLW